MEDLGTSTHDQRNSLRIHIHYLVSYNPSWAFVQDINNWIGPQIWRNGPRSLQYKSLTLSSITVHFWGKETKSQRWSQYFSVNRMLSQDLNSTLMLP